MSISTGIPRLVAAGTKPPPSHTPDVTPDVSFVSDIDGTRFMTVRSIALSFLTLFAAACTSTQPDTVSGPTTETSQWLFRAETAIHDDWQRVLLKKETDYRLAITDGQLGIQAVGQNSASGLIRRVEIDPLACSSLSWAWRVDTLQPDANLATKDGDDVAASLFLLFGDPGFLHDPDPVPTLRYVWTSARHPEDTIVDNPFMPGIVRSLVVQSGPDRKGRWMEENRDLATDFEAVFGYPPEDDIHAIALFTDNDQTKQPVVAHYGWAKVDCSPTG